MMTITVLFFKVYGIVAEFFNVIYALIAFVI